MIGPMMGSSSRTPGDHGQQDRELDEARVDQDAQQDQSGESRDTDDQPQQQLSAQSSGQPRAR